MQQIPRMFLRQSHAMKNSNNDLVQYIAIRSDMFCNTIIRRNIDFIKSNDCMNYMKFSLATEDKCKIHVIKELLFEDVCVLSRI